MRLGLHALAVTDHDGLYGIVRMAEAAAAAKSTVRPSSAPSSRSGSPDRRTARPTPRARTCSCSPARRRATTGSRWRSRPHSCAAARRASRSTTSTSSPRGRTGTGSSSPDAARAPCGRRSTPAAASTACSAPERSSTGSSRCSAPTTSSSSCSTPATRGMTHRNDALAALAAERGLRLVATGNVHYATPHQHQLATALAAVRARRSLDEMDGWLPPAGVAHLRSGAEMAARFGRYPGAVENTVLLADELAFELRRAKPGLPKQEVPEGHTPMSWLRELVWAGLRGQGHPGHRGEPQAHQPGARRDRDEGLPRLLPHRARHRAVREVRSASCARAAARPRTPRSATCWASPRSTRSSTSCRSSGSCRRCATRSPTSTSTSSPTGARRSSSTCSTSTAARTPRRSPTS